MEEIGTVKAVDPDTDSITIEFDAKGPCKSCGICLAGSEKSLARMQVQIKNTVQAKLGDKVEFAVKEGETLKASLKLYAFPLGMFLAGFVLGQKLAAWLALSQDIIGLLFAVIFFAGAFYVLNLLEKKNKLEDKEHIQLLRIL